MDSSFSVMQYFLKSALNTVQDISSTELQQLNTSDVTCLNIKEEIGRFFYDYDINKEMDITSYLLLPLSITISLLVFILIVCYCAFIPINWTLDLSDVGYDFLCENKPNSRRNKKLLVEQIRKLRKIGDLPPVYPNGWFALAESSDIKASQVKYVTALGEHFAIFRTKDGKINVLDAYCPHMGANMAIGGIVHGNCLECPFHGWKFSGDDGKCVDIPYSSNKVPPSAKVRKWLSKEVNNFIFIWYHAENEDPTWHIQHIPEIQSGKWWYRGRNEFIINSHIQEIPENGADVAHLNAIHAPSMLGGYDIRNYNKKWLSFCKHRWSAKWAACQEPDSKHIGVMKLLHEMCLFNKFKFITMDVTATQIGPSYVELFIKTTFGPMMVLQTVTPIEPMLQRVIHRVYSPPLLSPYATLVLYGETVMVARDVMVWNHKEYIRRPLLVKEDQTIQLHRRWYNQFYSENSPKFSFQKDNMEW